MTTKSKLAAVALAAAALAVACSDPKKKAAPPDVATPAAFCDALFGSYAVRFVACYHATAAYAAAYEDGGESCAQMEALVASGRVQYSAASAAACLAAIQAAPCDGLEHALALTPACATLLAGTVAPGGACAVDEECAAGTCVTTAECSGTCAAFLAAGAPCTAAAADCAPPLFCDVDGSGTCVANAPGAAGQACGPGELSCEPGLFCDAGRCRAKLAGGASCLAVIGAAYPCAANTFCHADSYLTPTRAECVPWVGAGAACGEWIGNCGPGLNCVSGSCVAEPVIGEPCSATVTCLVGSWCDAGTCAAPKPLGAPCTRYDQCGAAAYCDGQTGTCVAETYCMP